MEYAIFIITVLICLTVVIVFYREKSKLKEQLETAESKLETAESKLETAESELDTTKGGLKTTESKLETAESNLVTTKNELDTTKNELETTKNELDTTKNKLEISNKDKENALMAFYITHFTLKASISVLFSREHQYKQLKNAAVGTNESYKDFRNTVKSKAERRLVRKGAAVAMSFIPGLGLIDILGDLGEIIGDVDSASETLGAMSTTIEDLPLNTANIACHFVPDMVDDDISSDGLLEDAHNTLAKSFDEEFEEDLDNLSPDEPPNADRLELFAKHTMHKIGNLGLLPSMNAEEEKDFIEDIFEKAKELVEEAIDQHRTQKQNPDENDDASQDVE